VIHIPGVKMSGHNCPANPPQMVLNEERKQFAAVMQTTTTSLGQLADTRPQVISEILFPQNTEVNKRR